MTEGLSGRKYASLVEDNKTAAEADINTAHGQVAAGIYTSSDPTLANNDFGFLRLTSDGKLMVDTELTIDGGSLHIDNMFVYSTDNTPANARYGDIDANGYVSVNVMSMSGVVTDDSAQAATPQMINVGGEYRSGAPTTYTDGDATIFQTNMNGFLKIDGAGSQNQAVGASSIMQGAEAKAFDGSALPNTVTEGNAIRVAATLSGVQFVTLVNDDGSDYGQIKGYDSGTDSLKGFEVSPLSSHHVEETLLDAEDIADGTTYYYMDMDGYKTFSIQGDNVAGTIVVTLEATNQDDGTAAASCDYQDLTTVLTGGASENSDFFWIVDTPTPFKYVRVKLVTSGGANGDDLSLYSKKMY